MSLLDEIIHTVGIRTLLALAAGLALGISVVLFLRGHQVWARRLALGYSVYTAQRTRRRLQSWALVGLAVLVGLVGLAGLYVWWPERPDAADEAAEEAVPEALQEMRLVIPALAVNTTVIEAPVVAQQWDISRLRGEVAHLELTAYPGEQGNAVLAGHVTIPDAGPGPFYELEQLKPGDRVFVEQGPATWVYEVIDSGLVPPEAVDVALPSEDARLTLVTCAGWSEITEEYAQRVVVVARLLR
jgi:sortase A